MNIPEDLYERLIQCHCPYALRRLDGSILYARPDEEDWSAHEERQRTARELRSLAGAVGCVPLRTMCKRWRAIIDKQLAETHQRLYGVRPCAVAAAPQLAPVDAADEEARFIGRPPNGAPDSVTVPWHAAEYDSGTGTLVFSHAHRAAVRRLHACLAWRSAALQRDYPDYCFVDIDLYSRGCLAWTGFFANASHLPWRLDAHHIFIDRTRSSPDEDPNEDWPNPERFSFDGATSHASWKEEMDALLNFARALLPDSPLCHGLHVIQHLPEDQSLPAGERERYDLMGQPTHYIHREGESRQALVVDEEIQEQDDDAWYCGQPPEGVLEGACIFSFRADGADSCTPDRRYGPEDGKPEYEQQFGSLQRRGGRAWRSSDLEHTFARCFGNAEVVLDEVRFGHGSERYARCEHCDPDGDEDAPRARNATAHLIFRLLTDEPGGRGASERARACAPWLPPLPESESSLRNPWEAYGCMRLVISGTVQGLPCVLPAMLSDYVSPLHAAREEAVAWRMYEHDAALPPCPHAVADGAGHVTVRLAELYADTWGSGQPSTFFDATVAARDEEELAEPLRDIHASLTAMNFGLLADARVVRAILWESKIMIAAKLSQRLTPRQALRASLRAMGFGEWDDERLIAAIDWCKNTSRRRSVARLRLPADARVLPTSRSTGAKSRSRRSATPCECARCRFDAECGRDHEAWRIGDLAYQDDREYGQNHGAANRAGRACDALRAQLPMYTHAKNPRHYADERKFRVDR